MLGGTIGRRRLEAGDERLSRRERAPELERIVAGVRFVAIDHDRLSSAELATDEGQEPVDVVLHDQSGTMEGEPRRPVLRSERRPRPR